MAAANASHALKAKVSHAQHATPHLPHAATAHRAHPALKVRATVAVKATAKALEMVRVVRSSEASLVLTTVVMVKAVPHRVVHVLKAVDLPVEVKAVKGVKTADATMATNCHATLIR
jgi:hypothetical protein